MLKAQANKGNYTEETDIVIGFDFGTSCSKIIIRDAGLQVATAVPFGSIACRNHQYLVPTNLYIKETGELSLSDGKFFFQDLKVELMEDSDKPLLKSKNGKYRILAHELAAGYIALVIQIAREWFLNHAEQVYKQKRIHWQINIGIPSESYSDANLSKIFQTITMAAWRVSLEENITIGKTRKAIYHAKNHIQTGGSKLDVDDQNSHWLHPDFVEPHPEVIMEVVGYSRSPQRTSGLHLLIDVGASTMDIASFNIHEKQGENIFPLFETSVEKYGTLMLHKNRIKTINEYIKAEFNSIKDIDHAAPVPDLSHYKFELNRLELLEADQIFFQKCSANIGEIIKKTHLKRAPMAQAWIDGLPVFICGGGSQNSSYKDMIKKLESQILHGRNDFNGFIIKELPTPNQLEAPDLSHSGFDRLAVAYGLSFTSDEIGSIIPENEIEDIRKQTNIRNVEARYIYTEMT
ncbi:MAG: hypothetical protein ACQES9_11700 [Myxococcota bacterium]